MIERREKREKERVRLRLKVKRKGTFSEERGLPASRATIGGPLSPPFHLRVPSSFALSVQVARLRVPAPQIHRMAQNWAASEAQRVRIGGKRGGEVGCRGRAMLTRALSAAAAGTGRSVRSRKPIQGACTLFCEQFSAQTQHPLPRACSRDQLRIAVHSTKGSGRAQYRMRDARTAVRQAFTF